MRNYVLCVILLVGGLFGCRKADGGEYAKEKEDSKQLARREPVFMVSVAPILEREFGLIGLPFIYMANYSRVGSNIPGFVADGYLCDRFAFDEEPFPSVAVPLKLSALYRNTDTAPCAIKCDLELDMKYLNRFRTSKELSAASQNLLDSILDAKSRSIHICGDEKAALGPIVDGKRKVSISAPWPMPQQGEVLERNSNAWYSVESRALRTIFYQMKEKMLLADIDVAFLCDYPAYCSGLGKVSSQSLGHCGLILKSGKIVGKFSLSGDIRITGERSQINLNIYWMDDFRKALNPVVREQVDKLDPDTMQGDNSTFSLRYLKKANRMEFALPFDYKKGKIEALPNDNIRYSGKTRFIER